MNSKASKLEQYNLYREKLRRQAQKGDTLAFTLYTMPEYEVNWHHQVVADKLNRFLRKEIRFLMVFQPPRTGKSELGSRRLPAMIHGLYPNDEILAGSYNAKLASDFTVDVQRIMDTPEYSEIFPNSKISRDGKRYARNNNEHELIPVKMPDGTMFTPKGSYNSAGLDGSFTGKGANWFLLDDLIKNQEDADSLPARDKAFGFFQSAALSRLEKDGSILILMTRWNQDDVPGRLLKIAKEIPGSYQWDWISLPAIKEDGECHYDPRRKGESIWPSKFSEAHYENLKLSSGSRAWASLYQQRPFVESGNLVKRTWWQYFDDKPEDIVKIIQCWDTAQKVGLSNDYSVCATWAKTKTGYYILDLFRDRLEAPDLERMVEKKFNEFRPSAVLIEDKMSGSSIIQTLRRRTSIPVIAYDPGQKDKGVRLARAAPTIEAEKVFLPRYASWVEPFITEHEQFPGDFDDQCDTTSMAVDYFNKTGGAAPRIRSL